MVSHIIALIMNVYDNINTSTDMKNEQLDPIGIQIGVKQGDPMSPILFNFSVDPPCCLSWKKREVVFNTASKM